MHLSLLSRSIFSAPSDLVTYCWLALGATSSSLQRDGQNARERRCLWRWKQGVPWRHGTTACSVGLSQGNGTYCRNPDFFDSTFSEFILSILCFCLIKLLILLLKPAMFYWRMKSATRCGLKNLGFLGQKFCKFHPISEIHSTSFKQFLR